MLPALNLVGREDELDVLARFLDGEGESALLLEGPAGIGKSTVWEAGIAHARETGLRVLAARGADEEARLGYVGLGDLLADVELDAGALPEPQQAALEAALLLRSREDGGEPRAVAAALLGTLRALAADGPVVVAVDDVPWLDRATASALAFAARRLDPAEARFLLARRPEGASPLVAALERDRLRRLRLEPLSLGATRRLLFDRLGLALPRRTALRIHEAAHGNPLFALELGRALSERAGAAGEEILLPDTLEELLGARLARLSPRARRLVAAASLDPHVSPEELPGADALDEALERGVLMLEGERLRPAHPLLGTAALARLTPRQLRALHGELARITEHQELRARHLGLAAAAPDPDVAATVAAAAAAAAARGAAADAANLGELALRLLPPDAPDRPALLLAVADYHNTAGSLSRARDLLVPELETLPAGAPRARACLLLCQVGIDSLADSLALLDRALEESRDEPALRVAVLARRVYDTALANVGGFAGLEQELEQSLPLEGAEARKSELTALTSLAWVRALRGRDVGDLVERAAQLGPDSGPIHLRPERVVAVRRLWRGELGPAREEFQRLLARAEERGEAESYVVFRVQLCEVELRAGRWETVAGLLRDWGVESEEPIGVDAAFARFQALLAVRRGLPDEAERWAAEAIAAAEVAEVRWHALEAQRAIGIARLLVGDPAGAVASLRPVWEHCRREQVDDPGAFPVAPDLVEALVAADELDEARAVARTLAELAAEQDHPWARTSAARCAALVELTAEDAPALLAESADAYGELGWAFDRARTLHLLGTSLRLRRRRADARAALEQAADAFDELGSPGWTERARAELGRLGGRRRSEGLTPTETRVADLVAAGRRNQEVAAELVVSVRTVEATLSRIYAKLGVRSRTELAHRLAQES